MRLINTLLLVLLLSPSLLSFSVGQLQAKDMISRSYTLRDGLPHSNVFRLLQDKDGFIWAGTENGLCRFDGKRFTSFDDDYEPIKGRQILGILQSKDGALWINTYDSRLHKFHDGSFSEVIPHNSSFFDVALDIYLGYDNSIWSQHSPFLSRYSDGKLQQVYISDFYPDLPLGRPPIQTAFPLNRDTVLIGTDDGLYCYANSTMQMVEGSAGQVVYELLRVSKTTLIVGCSGRLMQFINGQVLPYFEDKKLAGKKIQQIEVKDNKSFWLAGEGFGPYVLTVSPEFKLDTNMQFADTQINDIMIDDQGGVWFATFGNGILYQSNNAIINYSVKNGLKAGYINDLIEDEDSNILAGTIQGLYKLDAKNQVATYISAASSSKEKSTPDWIEDLARDSTQTVWVSVKTGFVKHYKDSISLFNIYSGRYQDKSSTLQIETIPTNSDLQSRELILTHPTTMLTLSSGIVLASFWRGIVSLEDGEVNRVFQDSEINEVIVYCLAEDADQMLWIGSRSGLFGVKDGREVKYDINNGLPNNKVRAISFDAQGRIWVATDGGVAVKSSEGWQYYDESKGLTHNLCTALAIDQDGVVWVGTQYGLNYILNGTVYSLTQSRGLTSNEIRALLLGSDGQLWVGTATGVSMFNPRQYSFSENQPPRTLITRTQTARGILHKPKSLNLPHDSSQITIQYASLEYEYPEGVQFQYVLEGSDEAQWRSTSAWEREYPNLAPGEYTFRVRSRTSSGEWSPEAEPIYISVSPPFWQTVTFQIATLILGMGLTGWIFMLVSRSRQKERDEKAALQTSIASLQQQALNLTVNPHFLFNALTSIQNFFNTDNNTYRANLYLSKFSKLVRQVLDDSHSEQISLEDELERLTLYLELEKMRLGHNFEWQVDYESAHDPGEVKIPVMIIQPYVENAIWHGIYPLNGEGEISIRIWDDDEDHVRIRIQDNGIGIERQRGANSQQESRKSYGLSVTRKRIELHSKTGHGKIDVSFKKANPDDPERPGTIVEIRVKI